VALIGSVGSWGLCRGCRYAVHGGGDKWSRKCARYTESLFNTEL